MKKFLHFFHFGTLVLALAMLLGSFSFVNSTARAESAADIQDCFNFAATSRNGNQLQPITTEESYIQYAYDKIEKVTFAPTQAFLNACEQYNDKTDCVFKIDVTRAQTESVSELGNNIAKTVQNIFTGDFKDLASQQFDFEFDPPANFHFFSEDNEDDGSCANIGWGLYQFKITVSGPGTSSPTTGISKKISIKPTTNFPTFPKITKIADSSRWQMQNAYTFELTDECFKYCNQNLIKWYMCGEALDGTRYALTDIDLLAEDFRAYAPIKNWQKGIYNTSDSIKIERFGKTFTFDAKDSGTWEIWCVIKDVPVETHFTVTTGKKIEPNILIGVLIGLAVLLLIFVVALIIYTKRRERVW